MAGAGQLANTFSVYDAVGIPEDLEDMISDISPTDTPLVSNISSKPWTNTYHEWQTEALATAAQNHNISGFDITTYTAVTPTVRIGNWTSLMEKDFMVSGTEQAVLKAGRTDEMGHQAMKAAKELKRDMEVNFTANNAAVAGSDTTARETGGLGAWIKTNVSMSATNGVSPVWTSAPTGARSDGTTRVFTEAILKIVLAAVYTSGGEPTLVMVGPYNKGIFSGFAGIAAQRYLARGDGQSTIIGAADIYIGDFGELAIVPNRFMPPNYAYILEPDKLHKGVLRPVERHEMAKTGDADKMMFVTEVGLQVDNEKALGIVADLTTS